MKTQNENIQKTLEVLDFQFNQDTSSVFFVSDLGKIPLHPKIEIDLDIAKLLEADAVFFRFFDGNRLPQPQIYIYDNSTKNHTQNFYAEIHKNIWSASEIPLFMVICNSSVQIYDSRRPVTVDKTTGQIHTSPIDTIDTITTTNETIKQYKAQLFDYGSFWETEIAAENFLFKTTAYEKLLSGLKSIRKNFSERSNISQDLSDHLLIISVLIKYLEENGEDDAGNNLAQQFFNTKVGYNTFIEIIKNKKIVELFDVLAEHFNGGIFTFTDEQKNELVNAQLTVLTDFLEGKLDNNSQMLFWAEYSFKHIPIELISNFYEEFLPKEGKKKKDSGAVYTPAFLVNFLIDECLPLTLDNLEYNVKLIDVSCGSGIFLVTAFKRLVQRWRVAHKNGTYLANPDPEILKKILMTNIFGVDILKQATDLSIFSLDLSICSMLTPKQIWTELRFDDLSQSNVIHKDFFYYLIENNERNFDVVIGNPPFKGLNTSKYTEYEKYLTEQNKPFFCKIPDNQFALMFLDKAMDLLQTNGLLCLIMPSGPLLYNNTLNFRKKFFESYNIPQILDFTFLRNNLFETANVAVVALFAQKKVPDEKDILHVTVRRTKTSKEKQYFEIDHYDFHDVPKEIALTSDIVWKTNLIGGGRIFNMVRKIQMQSNETLEQFCMQKGWDLGQGFKIANKKNKDIKKFITGNKCVIDKYFTEIGIERTEIINETHFETIPKTNDIFTPPHVLIKKTIGHSKIPIEYRDDYLTFKNEIIGIHAPLNEKDDLIKLVTLFNDNKQLFRFYIVATSGRSGISRSITTSLLEDFMKLPIPYRMSLSLSDNIIIKDVNTYGIPSYEKTETAKTTKNAEISQLEEFSQIYCNGINSIYKENNTEYSLYKIYEGDSFFACEYCFSNEVKKPEYSKSENDFSQLLNNINSKNALIKRIIRYYGNNSIIMIKPKQLRYWLKSIALRDIDETLHEALENSQEKV